MVRLRRRASEQEQLLLDSALFDEEWYGERAGVRLDRDQAVRHYLEHGVPAGLPPHLLFDPAYVRRRLGPKRLARLGDGDPLSFVLQRGLKLATHPLLAPSAAGLVEGDLATWIEERYAAWPGLPEQPTGERVAATVLVRCEGAPENTVKVVRAAAETAGDQAEILVVDAHLLPQVMELPHLPFRHVVVHSSPEQPAPGASQLDGAAVHTFESFATHDPVRPDLRPYFGDTVSVMWTSGTTGRSKGVMQANGTWTLWSRWYNDVYRGGVRPGERYYGCVPMYNSGGWISNIYSALAADSPVTRQLRAASPQPDRPSESTASTISDSSAVVRRAAVTKGRRNGTATRCVRSATMLVTGYPAFIRSPVGAGRGSGSRSGPAPGVKAPRMRGPVAPVALGTEAGRPCAPSQPRRAMSTASFSSAPRPSASVVRTGTPDSPAASPDMITGLCAPPPETKSSVIRSTAMASTTVRTVSSARVAIRSAVEMRSREVAVSAAST